MADYPEWVLKHKKKGTYISRAGGKYYLYAAHSERVPGTKKVKLIHDGYIGRITEKDGLIAARDKVSGDVTVYEYGLCMTLLKLCGGIEKGLDRNFRSAAEKIFIKGLLSAAYGDSSPEAYHSSYLSVLRPGHDMSKALTDNQRVAAERCERMISDVTAKRFGEDKELIFKRLSRIYTVNINGKFYPAKVGGDTKEFLLKYGIDWGDLFGES